MADRDTQTGRFLTGNAGGPGRAQGSRNKLGEQFLEAMQLDFEVYGQAAIELVRLTKPADYLKVIASLMPKELHVKDAAPLEDMSDDELIGILEAVRSLGNRDVREPSGAGVGAPGDEKASRH